MTKPHRHCNVCGSPIPLEERTCSEKCEKILIDSQKRVRKTRIFVYVILGLVILVWLFLVLSRR